MNVQCHEIAAAQLTVDGEVEQREISESAGKLQANTDCPDRTKFQRRLLAYCVEKLCFSKAIKFRGIFQELDALPRVTLYASESRLSEFS